MKDIADKTCRVDAAGSQLTSVALQKEFAILAGVNLRASHRKHFFNKHF